MYLVWLWFRAVVTGIVGVDGAGVDVFAVGNAAQHERAGRAGPGRRYGSENRP